MSDLEWLASLKAGDEVLISNRWHPHIVKVERVTATLIVAGNQRFRKASGSCLGGSSWDRSYLRPVTQQDRNNFEATRLHAELTRHLQGKPTLAELRAMHACIQEKSA
jgi:hypothetical protein